MKPIGFVVATKDRPDDLRRMLESLALQTLTPDLVVVVDSSNIPVADVVEEFSNRLKVKYLHHHPPSASEQRNAGIEAVPPWIELTGFLDDDATLEPDALEKMLTFWTNAPSDLGGAAFNMVNHGEQIMARVKRWRVVKALGIYSGQPGRVTPSGWQTMTGFVARNLAVEWLPTTATVWRSEIPRSYRFDEFFDGYSYLEDLDFSYTVGRSWRMAIVADAQYRHHPSSIRHVNQYVFGKTEVRNRLYFVSQHNLSYPKCWLGLMVRTGMTLCSGVISYDRSTLSRACGNWVAMATEIRRIAHEKSPLAKSR